MTDNTTPSGNPTPEDRANPDPATGEMESRIHAADPARGMPDPRIPQMRARVLERTPDMATVAPATTRRTTWVVGGIAAAVVLLAGTAVAGAALGRATAPSADAVAAAAPPNTAQDEIPVVNAAPYLPSVGAPNGRPGGAPAPASGRPEMGAPTAGSAATADAKLAYPYWAGGGTSFIPVDGMADEPGKATGYRLVADGVNLSALARQLAEVFDVKGQPQNMDGAWMVGPEDYSGPVVWTYKDATASWSFSDPTQNPWACADTPVPEGTAVAPDSAGSAPASQGTAASDGTVSSGGSTGVEAQPCTPADKPIDTREALKQTRKAMAELGVTEADVDGIDIEWEVASDDFITTVTGWQRVQGARTQLSWSFSYGAKGVVWANGFAAGLEPVPDYPVVGAKTAVLRSAEPRWQSFGPSPVNGGPVPMDETGVAVSGDTGVTAEGTSPSPSPSVIDPTSVQIWWDPVTVTGAEPTLAQYWQQDGTLLLLPAYSLSTAYDRGEWVVIAVAEDAVTFVQPSDR